MIGKDYVARQILEINALLAALLTYYQPSCKPPNLNSNVAFVSGDILKWEIAPPETTKLQITVDLKPKKIELIMKLHEELNKVFILFAKEKITPLAVLSYLNIIMIKAHEQNFYLESSKPALECITKTGKALVVKKEESTFESMTQAKRVELEKKLNDEMVELLDAKITQSDNAAKETQQKKKENEFLFKQSTLSTISIKLSQQQKIGGSYAILDTKEIYSDLKRVSKLAYAKNKQNQQSETSSNSSSIASKELPKNTGFLNSTFNMFSTTVNRTIETAYDVIDLTPHKDQLSQKTLAELKLPTQLLADNKISDVEYRMIVGCKLARGYLDMNSCAAMRTDYKVGRHNDAFRKCIKHVDKRLTEQLEVKLGLKSQDDCVITYG